VRVRLVLGSLACLVASTATDGFADPPLPRAHAAIGETDGPPELRAVSLRKPTRAKRNFGSNGCSDDMVRVAGQFCIDRFEASMIDDDAERPLSPYYPPQRSLLRSIFDEWTQRLAGGTAGSDVALPLLPDWQREQNFRPRAVSIRGAVPQGYLNKALAEAACTNAGKRLCTLDEWTLACRGQQGTKFPYGPTYRANACNVFRQAHPGMALHGSFSVDLLDPRMNQVTLAGDPLLRPTGATETCKSAWGDDAVYDMVGNLDEWVDEPGGTFAGGFYARSTRQGCDSKITAHSPRYLDYSVGTRCCDRLR
jgi:sulfatase-modifying factor enzyme 1